MVRKHRVVLAIAVGIGLLVLAWALFVCREYSEYECQGCLATNKVYQWRVGVWPGKSLPLRPEREVISDSQILNDFFTPAHEHDWLFKGGTSRYLGVSVYAAGTGAQKSTAAYAYNGDPVFRAFIQGKIKAGELTADEFLRIARAPFSLGRDEPPEVRQAYERAEQLVAECLLHHGDTKGTEDDTAIAPLRHDGHNVRP